MLHFVDGSTVQATKCISHEGHNIDRNILDWVLPLFLQSSTMPSPHWGRDNMAAISRTTFSNAFSWMKMCEFLFKISLKFVPNVPINNISALVWIMAWCQPGDKPLSEPIMVSFRTHICIIWPQRVTWTSTNLSWNGSFWPNLNKHFSSSKCIWKYCLQRVIHFVPA